MTTRKALLISSQRGTQVTAEINDTLNFLLSPSGGAWTEDEIVVLHNPGIRTLAREVEKLNADYTITYFSGKGFPDNMGNHFLVTADDDFILDTELLNNSPRQVVIVDDCGGTFGRESLQRTAEMSDLRKARAMYDRWIENCAEGQLIMHATEVPGNMRDEQKAGLFTRKLLQVASSIPPVNDRFHLKSILATGHETPDLLLEEGFEEGPAITFSKGNIKLPFALALPLPPRLLPSPENRDGLSRGLSLGLFLIFMMIQISGEKF